MPNPSTQVHKVHSCTTAGAVQVGLPSSLPQKKHFRSLRRRYLVSSERFYPLFTLPSPLPVSVSYPKTKISKKISEISRKKNSNIGCRIPILSDKNISGATPRSLVLLLLLCARIVSLGFDFWIIWGEGSTEKGKKNQKKERKKKKDLDGADSGRGSRSQWSGEYSIAICGRPWRQHHGFAALRSVYPGRPSAVRTGV